MKDKKSTPNDPNRRRHTSSLLLRPLTEKRIKQSNLGTEKPHIKVARNKENKHRGEITHTEFPISNYREKILRTLEVSDNILIAGETGSGKSTMVPQFIYGDGRDNGISVAITQPRRIAAITLARRIAETMGLTVGDIVGYSVRFSDKTSKSTRIKYCTDGMLLRESLLSPLLTKYSHIVLDEIHERSLRTDILLGLLKTIQEERKRKGNPLKIVLMSATMDQEKFMIFFPNTMAINIQGRSFPITILYAPVSRNNYIEASASMVEHIINTSPSGDVLVFMPGKEEIQICCDLLEKAMFPAHIQILIHQVHSSLSENTQLEIFRKTPLRARKVIVATNIAETSITIPGIVHVVDCGLEKVRLYNSKLAIDTLVTIPISKSSAAQRAGRAGRISPGFCYRTYSEHAFNALLQTSIPEIHRTNLATMALFMKSYGINDLLAFEYFDSPPKDALVCSLRELFMLDAIDSSGKITALGKAMAKIPISPQLAKMLLKAKDFQCVQEMLTIVSMLSVENILYCPSGNEEREIERDRLMVADFNGDAITFLNIYNLYCDNPKSLNTLNVNRKAFEEALRIRKQLAELFIAFIDIDLANGTPPSVETIIQCMLACLFPDNIAVLQSDQLTYRTLHSKQSIKIHPSSSLFGKKAPVVMFYSTILTKKPYMVCVNRIDPLLALAK